MPTLRDPAPSAQQDDDDQPQQHDSDASGLIPNADANAEPDQAAKYSVTQEQVVTREDRDPEDREGHN